MRIEVATGSHVTEIVEIWKEFMDFHKRIDPFFSRSEHGHEKFGEFVKDSINSGEFLILVGLERRRVVAYTIGRIAKRPPVFEDREYGLIVDMAVRPRYRRRGFGEEMLAKLCEWFESRNIRRIELNVVPENHMGYSFWKKHGFREYLHVLHLDR